MVINIVIIISFRFVRKHPGCVFTSSKTICAICQYHRYWQKHVLQAKADPNYADKCLPGWRQTLKETRIKETAQRQWMELKTLPTPSEIKTMKNSEHSKRCLQLFQEVFHTPDEALDVCNYLMFRISIQNANCAGLMTELTFRDLDNAILEDDLYSIHITSHKTVTAYGGAILEMTRDLFQLVKRYGSTSRKTLIGNSKAPQPNDRVFVTKSGEILESNYVHKGLKSFAKKTEVLKEGALESFSHTMLRKITVTNTRKKSKSEIDDVAVLMAHSAQTANRHCHLKDKIAKSRRGHEVVRALFDSPTKDKKNSPSKEKKDSPEKVKNSQAEEEKDEKTTAEVSSSSIETEIPKDLLGLPSVPFSPQSTNTIPPTEESNRGTNERSLLEAARRSWSAQAKRDIQCSVGAFITGLKPINKQVLLAMFETNEKLRKLGQKTGMRK